MQNLKKVSVFLSVISSVIIILLTALFLLNKEKEENLTLKTYRNTVALYRDSEIIKTYDEIVLNTLPKQDQKHFNNGIYINTIEEANEYMLDYE